MKKQYESERTAALIEEAISVLERLENAPESPLMTFLPTKVRRVARRTAKQLRKGQLRPGHPNVHTPDKLATYLEDASKRDEIVERAGPDLLRIGREIRRVAAEEGQAAINTFNTIFNEAAGQRYRRLMFFVSIGEELEHGGRRQKKRSYADVIPGLRRNPSTQALWEATAAEILTEVPAGETVFAFPAEGAGERGRVLMRIGVRSAAWIGSFARGNKGPSTVQPMPGNQQLFVSAAGAGYIIDACSRKLVEQLGDDVVSIGRNESGDVFIVNHDDRTFEAFGPAGRLWKTDVISSGGFRNLTLDQNEFAGEARQTSDAWVAFSVDMATGAVSLGGG
ncbi:MAG TPA: hypothetical protein VGR95_01105 [Thermoanaerobaculia bacterium]|nr:hypothetical protein [Thermoanaerobaculia bacterium]